VAPDVDPVAAGDLLECRLTPDYSSVTQARHEAGRVWLVAGCEPSVAANVELATSELVTNAVEHTNSEIILRLIRTGQLVRVEVDDDGYGWPHQVRPDADEVTGRGLLLVAEISLDWGVEARPGRGKTTWAEFPCRGVVADR
jgi:anti-sigma regulatory factor (Ser/Thr protein kinase)